MNGDKNDLRAGDRLINPMTGENGVLIEAPSDGNGRRLVVEITVRPGGAVAGAHIHPKIEEAFTVLRGRAWRSPRATAFWRWS